MWKKTALCFLTAGCLLVATVGQAAIVQGIEDYQVFPLEDFRAKIPFRALEDGILKAEVIDPFDGAVVAQGHWNIDRTAPSGYEPPANATELVRTSSRQLYIPEVPANTGKPFTVRFRQNGREESYTNILIGELWVIIGGTNAIGAPGRKATQPIPMVNMRTQGEWTRADDPVFQPYEEVPAGYQYTTPWVRAAHTFYEQTGMPVGLLGIARPNLAMASLWNETGTDMPEVKTLLEKYGKKAHRLFWFQGEADAHPSVIPTYDRAMRAMADKIRQYTDNPNLVLTVVQLPRVQYPEGRRVTPYFGRIRAIQHDFCVQQPNAVLISTQQLSLRDTYRLDEAGVRRLGLDLGEMLVQFYLEKKLLWHGPRPARAEFTDQRRTRILVHFDNAEKLILSSQAEYDWQIKDDHHLGFATASYPQISDSGALYMQLSGARAGKMQSDPADSEIHIQLADTGFIQVLKVKIRDRAVQLDLAEPALPGATASYGLWDDAKGSLRNEKGHFAGAFWNIKVEEAQ